MKIETYFGLSSIAVFRFFLAFEQFCTHYQGPHSDACYLSIWQNSLCIDEGWQNPSNFSHRDRDFLKGLNLK